MLPHAEENKKKSRLMYYNDELASTQGRRKREKHESLVAHQYLRDNSDGAVEKESRKSQMAAVAVP